MSCRDQCELRQEHKRKKIHTTTSICNRIICVSSHQYTICEYHMRQDVAQLRDFIFIFFILHLFTTNVKNWIERIIKTAHFYLWNASVCSVLIRCVHQQAIFLLLVFKYKNSCIIFLFRSFHFWFSFFFVFVLVFYFDINFKLLYMHRQ